MAVCVLFTTRVTVRCCMQHVGIWWLVLGLAAAVGSASQAPGSGMKRPGPLTRHAQCHVACPQCAQQVGQALTEGELQQGMG